MTDETYEDYWPASDPASMNAYYGNPDKNKDGLPDRDWEAENLVKLEPPYQMEWSWGGEVKSIRIHKKCADSLYSILEQILEHYGSEEAVRKARMHLTGGAYNFRLMRGSARSLSMHSWGSAIDLDPVNNGLGVKWKDNGKMMPMAVVEIFEAEGATWGGRWKRGDAMHFQFCG